ncbi:hypothetical protein [Helicobacter sp. MIT 14-3879]|uniref:hypothetical protein n=1 Tax=Helicobacter sp. MIT 14-3879 TaxID=2040649 RepID=UPI000E1F750B|nr:hypothetical protein [Helicobacter sp. MIT 14-3879]RDU62637.1 hypothetical protein CQA44_06530 [Helicobacter sp. MIT 14-3879]
MQYFLKPYNIKVFTTPCVGNKDYLQKQFLRLINDKSYFPQIIETKEKIYFSKPHKLIFKIYREFLDMNIEFDLLYDCVMWQAIADNLDLLFSYKNHLFLHSGGISSNLTQLKRYEFKDIKTLQNAK